MNNTYLYYLSNISLKENLQLALESYNGGMLETLLQADTSALIWARGLVDPSFARLVEICGELIVIWVAVFLLFLWFTGVIRKDNRYRIWALEIFFIIILTFVVHAIVNLGIPQWRVSPQEVA